MAVSILAHNSVLKFDPRWVNSERTSKVHSPICTSPLRNFAFVTRASVDANISLVFASFIYNLRFPAACSIPWYPSRMTLSSTKLNNRHANPFAQHAKCSESLPLSLPWPVTLIIIIRTSLIRICLFSAIFSAKICHMVKS